jgi:hypothetical protein
LQRLALAKKDPANYACKMALVDNTEYAEATDKMK